MVWLVPTLQRFRAEAGGFPRLSRISCLMTRFADPMRWAVVTVVQFHGHSTGTPEIWTCSILKV